MDVTARYEPKIKRLLTKLLDSTFEIPNDLYLNTLISHFAGKYDADLTEKIQNLPIFTEWIIEAVSTWENHQNPSKTASIFILNLVALLSKCEQRFAYFKTFNIYNSLTISLKIKSPTTSPIIKLGFIKMLTALLEHKLGLDWLISTDNWREVLNFSLETPNTIYVVRESSEFILKMLKKSIDYNEIFCKLVVKHIVGKLNECLVCGSFAFRGKEIDEDILRRRSEPVLKLISFVFENFIRDNQDRFDNSDFRVTNLFVLTFSIENILWNYSNCAKSVDFTAEIDNCLMYTFFLKIAAIKSHFIPSSELRLCGASVIKLLSLKISKNQHLNVLKICFFASQNWAFLSNRVQKPTNETALLRLENHLVPIELLPIIAVTFNHCGKIINDLDIDEIRDEFVSKLFKTMSEGVTRVAFQFKDQLVQYPDIFPVAIAALRNILNGRKNFRRSRAILVFQGCVYSFKDITLFLKEKKSQGENEACGSENIEYLNDSNYILSKKQQEIELLSSAEIFLKNPAYLINLINCLSVLINENDITWAESLETICVLNVTIDFLNISIWNCRVKMEALKLLNLSISKYMSPNLALLLDNTQDSCLNQLGPLLLKNLNDENWEIRDSALEVLKTILNFSISKFPGFRDVLKNSNLLDIIIHLALNDSESFVRASGWKCLQESIKINEFWIEISKKDLAKKTLSILKTEPEAIVRTEIAKLMRCIYEFQSFPIDLIDFVYDSMFFAATKDFHWEVKTNALDFWGKVILNHLEAQGMIDNAFPEVTFSRENKKIIRLTETEIRTRLRKVLMQLADTGCLTVLLRGLRDDCDVEVVKKSVEKIKKIVVLLKMYKIVPEADTLSQNENFPSHRMENCQNLSQNVSNSSQINVNQSENVQLQPPNTPNRGQTWINQPPQFPSENTNLQAQNVQFQIQNIQSNLNSSQNKTNLSLNESENVGLQSPTVNFLGQNSQDQNTKFLSENIHFSLHSSFSDQIIDEIVNTNDLNLLENVSDGSKLGFGDDNLVWIKKRDQLIGPDEFLRAIDIDLDEILGSRTSWLETLDDFGSLLDDILRDYNTKSGSNVNEMDCY